MNKRRERIITAAALAVGAILIAVILFHAWKALTRPAESAAKQETGSIEAEAGDDIWVEETQLETNQNLTLSLKAAVLGTALQKKELVVFEQHLSDIIKVTDDGKLPFNLSAKYQYIKYSGTATYTVDLSGINDDTLRVDEDTKTLTIYIPHAVENLEINEEETQADDTENVGIFSIGDLRQTEQERTEVIADVKQNMEQKLKDDKIIENADRMAKLSVWEIYQPIVSKVSPEYTVVVEFL
ncbi:MAG: DUF4230 domain-containing protein [Eubacterium sp.]|nr:DUF4230 domain-containing protein [Eubacterium sp.]